MEGLGYRWMGRWGWNDAFERVRRCGEEEGGEGGCWDEVGRVIRLSE